MMKWVCFCVMYAFVAPLLCIHSVRIAVRWWEGGTAMSSVSILRVTVPSDLSTVRLRPANPSAR